MPITQLQQAAAQAIQNVAARDPRNQVRLLAGPGTGKSAAIEERVNWLLSEGAAADQIVVVSFTRAAACDLESRIRKYGVEHGHAAVANVRVSTLHSVALRILRRAGLLAAFPVEPRVLDDWELEHVFDPEFGEHCGIRGKNRREEIRRLHDAFWNTGQWDPTNYIPPDAPITPEERSHFATFALSRTQLYSCILPGQLIRRCVDAASTGTLDLPALLACSDLVVDEYQDLNPCDLQFIDILAAAGLRVFVSGDDDQSIYSFRFASPRGIQEFAVKYPAAGIHTLEACFRCTPAVLRTAYAVVQEHADPSRLPKNVHSLYEHSTPPLPGVVHRWRFSSSQAEMKAIAKSCSGLIAGGISADEIMILLSSVPTLGAPIQDALTEAAVPFARLRLVPFADTDSGRFALCMLRLVARADDYIALRSVLGLRHGVGAGTCDRIADMTHTGNLNYGAIFRDVLPTGFLKGRLLSALTAARNVVSAITGWADSDRLDSRLSDVRTQIDGALGADAANEWTQFSEGLPTEMALAELRQYLLSPSDADRQHVLDQVRRRLGLSTDDTPPTPAVKLMTMHAAKGLSAQVVFIPGLEESILPGARRSPFAGLVSEAARQLFVSITRARYACVCSFSTTRIAQGAFNRQTASRYCQSLDGSFVRREFGLSGDEALEIIDGVQLL